MTCQPCTDEINCWLDTTPQQLLPRVPFAAAAAYDATPAGAAGNRSARYQQWRSTVRGQIALIREHCREAGHQ